MSSVWREYGVIGTLLVVAVGGYLYMSRNQPDMLAASLDAIGGHLLALVPEGGGRSGVRAALDTLEQRVKEGSVQPEQIERYAASVFNLGTSGDSLAPEEAELVVRLAYADPAALPAPKGVAPAPPRAPSAHVTSRELESLASDLEPMVVFYESALKNVDSTGPAFRFYSDGRLHVVVDDRMRERIEKDQAAQPLLRDKAMSWRARFTEAAEAERQRQVERAEELTRIAGTWTDSLELRPALESFARLTRLRSLGFVPEAKVDSLMQVIEIEVKAALRDLPPPPPPPPADRETGTVSVSSSS